MSVHRRHVYCQHIVTALIPLLLAAVMMIGNANHASTWSDEGWNLWVIEPLGVGTTLARLAANHHPPLYFLSLDLWQGLAGESKLALRFLTIAGGLLTAALLYRIGTDQFGRVGGGMAALLFAIMEQSIYYSQAVRHYGWLVLGVCWMTLFFLRILRQPRRVLVIGYAAGVTFALYTMYLSVFILAVHGFIWLIWQRGWRDAWRWRVFAAWGAAGVLLLPWLIYAVPGQLHKVQRGVIAGYHNSFATTPENILKMTDLVFGGQFALMAGVCMLAIWQILQNRRLSQWTLVLSGIGLFAGLLILNLVIGLLAERTLYFLLPSILLVVGYGFQLMQLRTRVLAGAALVIWLVLTPQNVVPRINSEVVAQIIASGYSAGDLVLLETGFDDVAFENELKLTLPPHKRTIFRSYYEYDYPDDTAMLTQLNEVLQPQQRVWLVYWNVPQRLGQMLEAMGFVAQTQDFIPMGVNDPIYVAYPTITLTFYTRALPDAANRVVYGGLFALEDWLVVDEVERGEKLHIDLWWSPMTVPDRDYSINMSFLDMNGITQLQHFGPSAMQPTTTWRVGQRYYDRHTLEIPTTLLPGRYQVVVTVYWYQTPETPLLIDQSAYKVISELTVR